MKKKPQFQYLKAWKKLFLLLIFVFSSPFIFSQSDAIALNQNIISWKARSNYDGSKYEAKLNVNFQKTGIKELLQELETNSQYTFVYDKSILNYKKKFTLKENSITLTDLLNKISQQSNLRFKLVHNNINVRLAESVSLNTEIQSQDIEITGKVIAEDGMPVPGASVIVEDTSIGTVTDFDGNYSLAVPPGSSLVFSYIGMKTQIIPIGSKTSIDVTMVENVSALDEVVVVGYGTQKKSDITGAIGTVGAEEFEDEPVVEIGQALQGKVAGLRVSQNSGSPGSGLLIRIRGAGSVNNSDPLYVIDGNPNADPIDLVPEQIESIQILKSASSAAIYGAQGANGVILITTKKGKAGKPRLDINLSQGYQQIQKHIEMTNAMQYATLYNEGLINAGDAPVYPDPESLGVGTDWQDAVFRMAPMTNVSVSTSGGSETNRYFFSTGYVDQDGIVKGTGFNRLNMRVNTSATISPIITIGENLSTSLSNYQNISEYNFGSVLGNTLTANPEIPVKFPDGSWGYSPTSLNSSNPAASIFYTNNDTKRFVVNGDVYAEISFLKNFKFRSQYNFNIGYSRNKNFNPEYYISDKTFNEVADLTENTNTFSDYSWENTLMYNNIVGKHTFDLLGGFTSLENNSDFVSAYGAGLPANATGNENLRYLDLNTQSNRVEGNGGSYGILSFLGRVNYNYGNKYFATVNFRADGSSRFGENNKWGYFPSFSLGWKLSEETFLKDSNWMDNLMLRGGWGSLGNQGSLPNYAFANLVTPNINYVYGDPQLVYRGQAPTGLGNPDLKWESTEEINFGLDFTGFNGKVSASLDWYRKETSDMLLQVPIAGYSGIQDAPYVNGGNVLNQGYEISLGYEDTTESGWTYGLSGNVAHNKNEVLDLSNAGSSLYQFISFVGLMNVTQVGSPIASFYGWQTDGLFQSTEEVNNHAFQSSGTAPGDIRFKDLNGDGVINADDQTIIGNPSPTITYGINGSLAYKNFSFRLALQGVAGNEIFQAYKFRTEGANFFNYTKNVWDNRWTGPGTSNDIPRLNTDDPNNNFRSSDYYLEDGSYLRIRNIQLTFKFPENIFNTAQLSIYGSIQNAYTFTKYSGFDPELGSNSSNNSLYIGIDETNYPVPRIFTLGLKLGL